MKTKKNSFNKKEIKVILLTFAILLIASLIPDTQNIKNLEKNYFSYSLNKIIPSKSDFSSITGFTVENLYTFITPIEDKEFYIPKNKTSEIIDINNDTFISNNYKIIKKVFKSS